MRHLKYNNEHLLGILYTPDFCVWINFADYPCTLSFEFSWEQSAEENICL